MQISKWFIVSYFLPISLPNPTKSNSTQPNSIQLNPIQLNSTQHNQIISSLTALLFHGSKSFLTSHFSVVIYLYYPYIFCCPYLNRCSILLLWLYVKFLSRCLQLCLFLLRFLLPPRASFQLLVICLSVLLLTPSFHFQLSLSVHVLDFLAFPSLPKNCFSISDMFT